MLIIVIGRSLVGNDEDYNNLAKDAEFDEGGLVFNATDPHVTVYESHTESPYPPVMGIKCEYTNRCKSFPHKCDTCKNNISRKKDYYEKEESSKDYFVSDMGANSTHYMTLN